MENINNSNNNVISLMANMPSNLQLPEYKINGHEDNLQIWQMSNSKENIKYQNTFDLLEKDTFNLLEKDNKKENNISSYSKEEIPTTISDKQFLTFINCEEFDEMYSQNDEKFNIKTPLSPISDTECNIENINEEKKMETGKTNSCENILCKTPPSTPPLELFNQTTTNTLDANFENYQDLLISQYLSLVQKRNPENNDLLVSENVSKKRKINSLESNVISQINTKKEKIFAPKVTKKKIKENNRKIICYNCHTDSTPLWRRTPDRLHSLCNACGLYYKQYKTHRPINLQNKTQLNNVSNNNKKKKNNLMKTSMTQTEKSTNKKFILMKQQPIRSKDMLNSFKSTGLLTNLNLNKDSEIEKNLNLLNNITATTTQSTLLPSRNESLNNSSINPSLTTIPSISNGPNLIDSFSTSSNTGLLNVNSLTNDANLVNSIYSLIGSPYSSYINSTNENVVINNNEKSVNDEINNYLSKNNFGSNEIVSKIVNNDGVDNYINKEVDNYVNGQSFMIPNNLYTSTIYGNLSEVQDKKAEIEEEEQQQMFNIELEEKKFRGEVESMKRQDVQRLLNKYDKRCEFLRGFLMATRNKK